MRLRPGYFLAPAILAGACTAALIAAVPARAADAEAGATNLYLHATIQVPVAQDVVLIRLRAQAEAADPAAAQSAVNLRMSDALATSRTLTAGQDPASMTVSTGDYAMWCEPPSPAPRTEAGAEAHGRTEPARWWAAETLTLKGTNLPGLLDLMGELQKKGLITQGMQFQASAPKIRAAVDDATTQAVLRLREEAGKIASSLGMSVVQIQDLRVEGTGEPRPVFAAMPRMMAAPAGFAAPVATPGEGEVTVTVAGTMILHPASR